MISILLLPPPLSSLCRSSLLILTLRLVGGGRFDCDGVRDGVSTSTSVTMACHGVDTAVSCYCWWWWLGYDGWQMRDVWGAGGGRTSLTENSDPAAVLTV